MRRRVLVATAVVALLAAAGALLRVGLEALALSRAIGRAIVLPDDDPPALLFRWFDTTPVAVRYTAAWEKFIVRLPRYEFRSAHPLWGRMHFEDWDYLAESERHAPLQAMLDRSGVVVHAGDCWPHMTTADWDAVPQPIRAVAILGVLEYWTRYYAVGSDFDLEIIEMVEVVQSIVMSESWFEHQSLLVNDDGSRDLGLGGASAYARGVIASWYTSGRVDFVLAEDDYFNPWHAGRFVAFWFDLMLEEADGDVGLAIRAYNQGIGRARAGHGDDYLAAVRRRQRQFIAAAVSRSPTWNLVRAWQRRPATAHRPRCHRIYGGSHSDAARGQRTINSPRISAHPDSARMLQ